MAQPGQRQRRAGVPIQKDVAGADQMGEQGTAGMVYVPGTELAEATNCVIPDVGSASGLTALICWPVRRHRADIPLGSDESQPRIIEPKHSDS